MQKTPIYTFINGTATLSYNPRKDISALEILTPASKRTLYRFYTFKGKRVFRNALKLFKRGASPTALEHYFKADPDFLSSKPALLSLL